MERRSNHHGQLAVETRADGKRTIVGYGAVFYRSDDPGTEYRLWEDMVEHIAPTAFDAALSRPDDVRGLFNHDPAYVLGRTTAKTMRLSKDAKGLRYEIDVPDTQLGRDLLQSIERGDITGSSFAFSVSRDGVRMERDAARKIDVRTVTSVSLYDVGPVTYPAYESATTGTRSTDGVREALTQRDAWRAMAAQKERERRLRVLSLDVG
jgi:HK97 family phage prohead protease